MPRSPRTPRASARRCRARRADARCGACPPRPRATRRRACARRAATDPRGSRSVSPPRTTSRSRSQMLPRRLASGAMPPSERPRLLGHPAVAQARDRRRRARAGRRCARGVRRVARPPRTPPRRGDVPVARGPRPRRRSSCSSAPRRTCAAGSRGWCGRSGRDGRLWVAWPKRASAVADRPHVRPRPGHRAGRRARGQQVRGGRRRLPGPAVRLPDRGPSADRMGPLKRAGRGAILIITAVAGVIRFVHLVGTPTPSSSTRSTTRRPAAS